MFILEKNKFTDELVAIKSERKEMSAIKNEAKMYNYLNNSTFFPKLKDYITTDQHNYLVLELLNYHPKQKFFSRKFNVQIY